MNMRNTVNRFGDDIDLDAIAEELGSTDWRTVFGQFAGDLDLAEALGFPDDELQFKVTLAGGALDVNLGALAKAWNVGWRSALDQLAPSLDRAFVAARTE